MSDKRVSVKYLIAYIASICCTLQNQVMYLWHNSRCH